MKTIEVRPAPDGYDMQSNWVVAWSGRTSAHTKKSAAKRKAREVAHDGDQLVIKGTDGAIIKNVTVRDASVGSSESEQSGDGGILPGIRTFKTGVSDAYDE